MIRPWQRKTVCLCMDTNCKQFLLIPIMYKNLPLILGIEKDSNMISYVTEVMILIKLKYTSVIRFSFSIVFFFQTEHNSCSDRNKRWEHFPPKYVRFDHIWKANFFPSEAWLFWKPVSARRQYSILFSIMNQH